MFDWFIVGEKSREVWRNAFLFLTTLLQHDGQQAVPQPTTLILKNWNIIIGTSFSRNHSSCCVSCLTWDVCYAGRCVSILSGEVDQAAKDEDEEEDDEEDGLVAYVHHFLACLFNEASPQVRDRLDAPPLTGKLTSII